MTGKVGVTLRRMLIVVGLGAIVVELLRVPSTHDGRWLLWLGGGGALTAFGLWPTIDRRSHRLPRAAASAAFTLFVVFGLLAAQLLRLQVVGGNDTFTREAADPETGQVVANPRAGNADLRADRGSILDRSGKVLAETRIVGGVAHRLYPDPASYVAGYFSPLKYGKTGLEAEYDATLAGADAGNPFVRRLDSLLHRPAKGGDVRLTIDAGLQARADALLAGRTGSIVVIDVKTGAVVVMASSPHVDPSRLIADDAASAGAAEAYWASLNADPAQPLLPRATNGLYTPGSTFKIVTASAAIDTGATTPDEIFVDDGALDVDGHVIVENNRPDASVTRWTLRDGIAYSLNVVLAQVGLKIGGKTLGDYAQRFGFGEKIPFDLPVARGQVSGSAAFLDAPAAVADTAFGQGQLLTTPLGMAVVAATIANGGVTMTPYLVRQTTNGDGEASEPRKPGIWRTPIGAQAASDVAAMMVNAVDTGYAGKAAIDGFVVGGKTGTAETGDGREPHAWFIGFIGAPEPRFAVAVVLEHGGKGLGAPLSIAREMLSATVQAYP